MKIRLDKEITLFGNIPKPLMIDIKKDLVFDNPMYLEATQNGRLTKGILRRINLVKENRFRGRVSLPKGYYYKLMALVKKHKVEKQILHNEPVMVSLSPIIFKGKLERDQLRAGMLIKKKEYGVFRAPTGSGKTITTLWVIAETGVATLILVHTSELLYQWRDKIREFLVYPSGESYEAGLVGDGHREYKPITVAIKNSLMESVVEREFGMLVVDECHRAPAETFAEVIGKINTKYLLGLTATTKRSDGLDKLIYYYMGDLVHSIESDRLEKLGRIIKPELKVIQTNFSYYMKSVHQRHAMIQALTKDKDRNTLIAYHVNKQLETHKGIALIISDRKEHCESLKQLLLNGKIKAEILMSSVSAKQRREVVERLQAGESEALVATSQLIGEGFDLPTLSSIFLTMPIKFDGRLQQYIGRIVRIAKGKDKAIIYDFSDKCWLLQHSLKSRMEYYKSVGIETL